MKDAKDIIESASNESRLLYEYVRPTADWFHGKEGQMAKRQNVINKLTDKFNVSDELANRAISELVADQVDPVVQVISDGEKYVGIVDYETGDCWYAYTDYHDKYGKRERVVCAKCVQESEYDTEVATATEYEGSIDEASRDTLVERILEHYEESHDEKPEDVETGASLLSGTTIGGNTAFHAGNDGTGSGLDADTVDGTEASGLGGGEPDPIYGTGADGNISRSSSTTEPDIIFAENYTVESGVTVNVNSPLSIIHATDTITINGTLSATGQGASGGGANSNGNSGDLAGTAGSGGGGGTGGDNDTFAGGNGSNGGTQAGGGGGGGGAHFNFQNGADGNNGGNGASENFSQNQLDQLKTVLSPEWDAMYNINLVGGSGGGGGGDGGRGGSDDTTPNNGGSGGAGGDGGGLIVLFAPTIDGSGTVIADGTNASDGTNGGNGNFSDAGGGGGGGGGGGSGGFIAILSRTDDSTIDYSVDPGSGGTGGSGGSEGGDGGIGPGGDGGDGGSGGTGLIYRY